MKTEYIDLKLINYKKVTRIEDKRSSVMKDKMEKRKKLTEYSLPIPLEIHKGNSSKETIARN